MSARDWHDRVRADPVAFCRQHLAFEPWSKQAAVLEALRDHPRVAVRSAHGVGKTAVAARAVLWWLAAFGPAALVVTTSATWSQVREQLWREIAVGFHAAAGFLDGVLTDTRLELAADWFALGLSTDTPERFAGYHSENLLVVLDEASGVSEAVWEAAETLVTSSGSKLLAIGNPTRPAGAFYRAFHSERALYAHVAVSAFDSPAVTGERVPAAALRKLVSREWIEGRRRAWGETSPLWQVRVLGEFPRTADDTVVALADVEAAQRQAMPPVPSPLVVACDVARFGSDETVIGVRTGQRVRIVETYTGRDLMATTGAILRAAGACFEEFGEVPTVVVDDAGLGGGVTDRLRELRDEGRPPWARQLRIVAFNGAERARYDGDYPNRRSEAWFRLAERLGEVDLPADEQLAADLVAPRYRLDSRGRRVVEPKSDTKRRLGRSPDRGDAVVMAFTVDAADDELWMPVGPAASRGRGWSLTGDLDERLGVSAGWGPGSDLAYGRFLEGRG